MSSKTSVRVSVTEGVVAVATGGSTGGAAGEPAPLRLTAGERVIAGADGAISAPRAFDGADLAWRTGRLVFHEESLAHVVAAANRYRDVKIALLDPELAALPVTISVPSDNTDQLLTALEVSAPVVVRRSSVGVTVRLRRDDQ